MAIHQGGYAFYGLGDLTEIVIPSGVEKISGYAFYYCDAIKQVTLPSSLTHLYSNAFSSCYRIKTVYIGTGGQKSRLTSIGAEAFCYTDITDVYYEGSAEDWDNISKHAEWSSTRTPKIHCLQD